MNSAKNVRLDKYYELTADIEIIKYGISYIFMLSCKKLYKTPVVHYRKKDLKTKRRRWNEIKKEFMTFCARETEEVDEQVELRTGFEYQKRLIEAVRKEVRTSPPIRLEPAPVKKFVNSVNKVRTLEKLGRK